MLTSTGGHSAVVKLELWLHSGVLSVRQLSSTFVILDGQHEHAPVSGIIALRVDEQITRFHADFPSGINPERRRQPLTLRLVEQIPSDVASAL